LAPGWPAGPVPKEEKKSIEPEGAGRLNWLLVGIGGTFGALARYELGKAVSRKCITDFPLGTLINNISGALLLGVVFGMDASGNMALLLADGFLGAFTTFSTFMYESYYLLHRDRKLVALAYLLVSLVLGITGYLGGLAMGSRLLMG
jgi:CrcB protein